MPYTGISTLFEKLVANTQLTPANLTDASGKHGRVRATLNSHYYGVSSESDNSFLVGSYGKATAIRPPSDVDILFVLPDSVYLRFLARTGNIQSQLLQEVKGVLQDKYQNTKLKADGQIISVSFVSYAIEVFPAFSRSGDQYLHADSNAGGSWKTTDPLAEKKALEDSNRGSAGKTIHLVKLAKAWKRTRNVDLASFAIELFAVKFMSTWQHRATSGYVYYDFLVRDFLTYLVDNVGTTLFMPGTYASLNTGTAWRAQAEIAKNAAVRATQYGQDDMPLSAASEWKKIFGDYVE